MVARIQPTVTPFAAERLADLKRKVRLHPIIVKVWKEFLTEDERQRVTTSTRMGPDIVDIWAKLKKVSPEQAVIEIARKTNFLFPDEDQDLLRHLGFSRNTRGQNTKQTKPVFGADGILKLGDRILRIVPRKKIKTKPELLLQAFQAAKWVTEIANPFPGKDVQYLHNAVRQTNKNLACIRFSVLGGGTSVTWTRT